MSSLTGDAVHTIYDTRRVHPLDRYDYYRAAARTELAPVAVRGRSPDRLFAAMTGAQIGDFALEAFTWAADSEISARRTSSLIRISDPESYRILLDIEGGVCIEQAGRQVRFRPRDIALYDLSQPWQSTHTIQSSPMRTVTLTFPRALLPFDYAIARPLFGSALPRILPGRSLIAQFLAELTDTELTDTANCFDTENVPHLADVLRECTVGLIRQRLGLPNGITASTRRLLHTARIRGIIRRNLGDPELSCRRIAAIANVSSRSLHQLFHDSGTSPMQLLKRMRLQLCHRDLQDTAMAARSIGDILAAHGYRRHDQFARDFRQEFGVSATEVRKCAQ
jgi:AraC-like DNA-binding protein